MSRLLLASTLALWAGATLLLGQLRWFRRVPLAERLRPYAPRGMQAADRSSRSVASFRELVAPLAQDLGERLSRAFGVSEPLEVRLRRIHSPLTVSAFRTRQLGWSGAAFGLGLLGALALRVPPALALLLVVGSPLLAFLLLEQQVQGASHRRQRRVFLELPVVTEQLGMLLSAGYSMGSALNRLAQRSHGTIGEDLALVCGRLRQGLSEVTALREWADLAQVEALHRLVAVLALNREAGDLGTLITEEARSIRADAHRELLETIERRSQQVWIPVTVATLVPGVLFMAVPFMEALRLFTGP